MESTQRVIRENVALSKSVLWELQKEYFCSQGIEAWAGHVPYYITNNPYIANSYAQIIIRFMQDYTYDLRYNPKAPFYIIELGAGSGCFSFYTIKRLCELQDQLGLEDISFKYIMTDLAVKNISFWRGHERFQEFIKRGVLDFAVFNLESDSEIKLGLAEKSHSGGNGEWSQNPLIVLANYIFDTVSQDLFYLTESKVQEGLAVISTPGTNIKENRPIGLEGLNVSFEYREVEAPYYREPVFADLLLQMQQGIGEGFLLFPITVLRCLHNLMRLAGGQLCLISSDKGFSRNFEYYRQSEPRFAFHGSFSLGVNYKVIEEFFKLRNGECYHQFGDKDLTTSVFIAGNSFTRLPEFRLAVEGSLDGFGHAAIYQFYKYLRATQASAKLNTLLLLLNSARWDPYLFHRFFLRILELIRSGEEDSKDIIDLAQMMPRFAEQFYYIPHQFDVLFDIGFFFQELEQYEVALEYYQRSWEYFGEVDVTFYNQGLCYYFLHDPEKALESLQKAVELNPEYILARGWIAQIEAEDWELLINMGSGSSAVSV